MKGDTGKNEMGALIIINRERFMACNTDLDQSGLCLHLTLLNCL